MSDPTDIRQMKATNVCQMNCNEGQADTEASLSRHVPGVNSIFPTAATEARRAQVRSHFQTECNVAGIRVARRAGRRRQESAGAQRENSSMLHGLN
jgi:hypothetical protein